MPRLKDARSNGGNGAAHPAEPAPRKESFANVEQQVFLNLQRTADLLMRDFEDLLKPTGLSVTQYHILRVLRSDRTRGFACHEITERMTTHDPDMTRLLDRLEKRKLLTRLRSKDDRRIVLVKITGEGLSTLRGLEEDVRTAHKKQLGHMGPRRLDLLNRLLKVALRSED